MSQSVALIMKRKILAQSLMKLVREEKGINMCFKPDYADSGIVIRGSGATCALIEVSESGEYDMDYCLALCTRLRKETPDCKLILLCPETDEEYVALTVKAKRANTIDDFIFYDTSLEYLISKLCAGFDKQKRRKFPL